mgnify:CR=1 FL=1
MQLECLEGRIHGSRYYTVKPQFGWDLANDWGGVDAWQQMTEWCVETFGPSAEMGVWEPGARWYANNAKFWFRREADRTLFVLRWQ